MDPNKFLEKIGATQDNMPLDGSTDSEIRPPPVSRDPTPQTIPINYTMEYGSQAPTLGMVISPWPNAVKHNARGEIAVLLEQFGKHSAENAHIVDSQYFPFPWGLDACKKMLENKKMQYDRTIWRTALLFFPMWVYTPTLKMLMNSDQTEPKWMAPIVLTSELLMEYMCALDIQRFNKDVPAAMRSESLKRHESMLEKRTNLYVENCHLTAQFKQLYDRRDEEGFDPTQHAEVLKLFATFTTMHTISVLRLFEATLINISGKPGFDPNAKHLSALFTCDAIPDPEAGEHVSFVEEKVQRWHDLLLDYINGKYRMCKKQPPLDQLDPVHYRGVNMHALWYLFLFVMEPEATGVKETMQE